MTDPDLRDPNLDRAYRETPRDEPPPELDDRIRAAARRAVGTRPQSLEQRAIEGRRRSWASRWRLPLSVAATVVIAATLTVMVQEEERRPRDDAGPVMERRMEAPSKVEQQAAPTAGGLDAASNRMEQAPVAPARSTAAPPAPPPAQPSPQVAPKSTAEPAAPQRPDAAPQLKREERPLEAQRPATAESAPTAPAELEMRRQAPASAAAPPPAASPPLAPPAPAPGPGAQPALRSAPQMAPAGAASGSLQRDRTLGDRPERASREPSAIRSPEAWVEYIRSLRAQGRDAEATAELAELRRAYPDFQLPDDLAR